MKQGPRIGSLCTGYGGLDMAVMVVFDSALAWCADNDRHAATVLSARYAGVPNLGDITRLDWQNTPQIDILCAGFPCQDISYAGRGAGIKRGTRSGIWINIVEGIRLLAPKVIILENVAAIRRRGLDRVLGDLAALGYDASWTSVRASDVGAAHRRERVFILAHQPNARNLLAVANAHGQRRSWRATRTCPPSRGPPGGPQRSVDHRVPLHAAAANATGEHRYVASTAKHPRHSDAGIDRRRAHHLRSRCSESVVWSRYEPAIRRWEAITGRPAPYPTETGTKGQPRLSPAFSEWLMGLPGGFVTDLGLPYTAQHRLIGNGVVPQQAVAALHQLVSLATRQSAEALASPRGLP